MTLTVVLTAAVTSRRLQDHCEQRKETVTTNRVRLTGLKGCEGQPQVI